MSGRPELSPICEHGDGCVTCGDTAVWLEVTSVDAPRGLAVCADGDGRLETVDLGVVDRVSPGQRLLVHAGTALQLSAEST